MKKTLTLMTASLALALGTSAHAAILNGDVIVVDFGKDTVTTPANWNNVTGPGGSPSAPVTDAIRFSDGAATGVGVRLLAQEDGKSGIGGATVGAPATTSSLAFAGSGLIPTSALEDVAYLSNELLGDSADDTNGVIITGLDDSLTYNIAWVSSINAARDEITWTVDGQTFDIDPEDNTTVYQANGVSTNGSGEIVISVDISQTTNGPVAHLNALEIVAVPEPASLVLMGLGGLLMLSRKRPA